MFERFTDRSRRVLVLAQEESRLLNHGFIGTEHILLGLIDEGQGVAATALAQMDITLEAVRERVEELLGVTGAAQTGSPPFTPRAKKVLELSLREALQLGHNYIGTEHMLLGLIREGEGVGAQVLVSLGADLHRVRQTVIRLLADTVDPESEPPSDAEQMTSGSWIARRPVAFKRSRVVKCSFCGREPPETGRLIAGENSYICEHCLDDLSPDKPMTGDSADEE